MDLVEFFCKFGTGDFDYITYYFGENNLLYSILKEHDILNCDITKIQKGVSHIEYIMKSKDTNIINNVYQEYINILKIEDPNTPLSMKVIKVSPRELSIVMDKI